MQIYRVQGMADNNQKILKILVTDATETPKCFIFNGYFGRRRINKDRFNVIESVTRGTMNLFFACYCLEEDLDVTKQQIMQMLRASAIKQAAYAEQVLKRVDEPTTWIEEVSEYTPETTVE